MGAEAIDEDLYLENGRFTLTADCMKDSSPDCVAVRLDPWKIHVLDVTHGNNWEFRVFKPGATEHMTCTLEFRISDKHNNKDIKDWMNKARQGDKKMHRQTITVNLCSRAGQTVKSWSLIDCFPTHYDAGDYTTDSTSTRARLVVHVGRMDLK